MCATRRSNCFVGIDRLDEPEVEPRARRRRNDRPSLTADAAAGLHRVDVQRRQVVAQLEPIGRFSGCEKPNVCISIGATSGISSIALRSSAVSGTTSS